MKNTILIIASIFAMFNVSIAQEEETDFREELQIGAKIGANYSNVYDSEGEQFNADAKLGLAAGGFVSIPFGKYLGFQPELLLSQKGFKATGMILGSPYQFTRTTTYIDIPLFLALKPSEFITLVAGPQYSYLIKQNDNFAIATTSIDQQQEFKNDNFRKNTLCFTGGVDFTLKQFVIGARAGWDVQNNIGDGTSSTPRYKNVWYQLTAGFRF